MQCALIEGHENYQVCDNGHVYSLLKKLQLKPLVNPTTGYLTVGLRANGKRTGFYNHHLVAKYFMEPAPAEGMELDHQDSDKHNNTPGNLQWLTSRANVRKRIDKTTTSSKYFGVCQDPKNGKWIASIWTNGKRPTCYIGRYLTELEAVQAHNEEALKYGVEPQPIQD